MEPLPWTLLVCLLLTCQVTGNRLSGAVGVQHCEKILTGTFPERMYHWLQSYQMMPSIGSQLEYMEFTIKGGKKFCVIRQKAQLMKEYIDSQSRGNEKLIQKTPQAGSPAVPKAADPMGVERRTIFSLATTPLPTVEGQDQSNGMSTLSIPQSTRLCKEEETPTSTPSAKPFPRLKEQHLRPLFPLSKSTGLHKEEGVPTLDPPTTLYSGPQEQMEEWRTRPMLQDQPVAHSDVPTGQEPTESSRARNTGTSAAETPQDGSKEGGGRSTSHMSSPGATTGDSGLRPGEEEVVLGVHPIWGSSQKRHGGSGETGRDKSPFFMFLGLLALAVFLTILGVFAYMNSRATRMLQGAQIQMAHYSKVTGSSDDIL